MMTSEYKKCKIPKLHKNIPNTITQHLTNLWYIRSADCKNDLTFAKLALVFETIWIHSLVYRYWQKKNSGKGHINYR